MIGLGYIAALDIGGTHARLAVQPLGDTPRFFEMPGFTLLQNGPEDAARRCWALMEGPLAALGTSPGDCQALCCGAAGVDTESDRRAYKALLVQLGFAPGCIQVYNDCELLLAALDRPALLVAAGTGSLALARSADGRFHRCGGWGFFTSDEGSACRLALDGLACAVRAWDGADRATALTALLEAEGIGSAAQAEALARAALADKSRLAALAPLVLRAAQSGDKPASQLVWQAVRGLGGCALAAARKAKLYRPPLLLWGSLLTESEVLSTPLTAFLQREAKVQLLPPGPSALESALTLARARLENTEKEC